MSAQVNVREIHALDELRAALVRFSGEANAALQAATQEAQRTLEWLAERQATWQREVRRRQEILQAAHAALRDCQSQVYYDEDGRPHRPDCSGHQAQVSRARAYLAEGEAELQNVVRWAREVQQATASYQREAQRLSGMLINDLPKAAALLNRSVAILQNYVAVGASESASGTITQSAASSTEPVPVPGRWVEQGIQDVSLDQIDVDESYVHGPEDFRKVSYEEMRAGVQRLEQIVRPAVNTGADGEYFSQLDAKMGLNYADGLRKLYDAFYGAGAPIRLNKIGNRYEVVNGYHRLRVALDLGLTSIPANVVALEPMD